MTKVARLELLLLSLLALNVYGRIWIWVAYGSTINPGVAIVALPLAIFSFAWCISHPHDRSRQASPDVRERLRDRTAQSQPSQDQHDRSVASDSVNSIWATRCLTLTGCALSLWGMRAAGLTYEDLAFAPLNHRGQHIHNLALLYEGAGVIAFWSAWTWRYAEAWGGIKSVLRLHFPISIAIFGLPWEGLLRKFDEPLQRLSTDLAVFALDLSDMLTLSDTHVRYWDAFTVYSDRFYLIINETCAGVNLLLSMSLYALGFGWVMGVCLSRAWLLVAYMIPLSILFNGLRIAVIFMLGHSGSVALATGPWHEGSGYLCQLILFVLIALINRWLDRAPMFLTRDPSV